MLHECFYVLDRHRPVRQALPPSQALMFGENLAMRYINFNNPDTFSFCSPFLTIYTIFFWLTLLLQYFYYYHIISNPEPAQSPFIEISG